MTHHQLGREFFASQDQSRGAPAPALCADDYQVVIGGGPPMDHRGHEGFARAFYGAFPDLSHTVEDVLVEADRIAVRFVLRGTHREPFFGIPATGRSIEVAAHVIMDVADGKVRRLRGVFDEAGMLRQLGVLPG